MATPGNDTAAPTPRPEAGSPKDPSVRALFGRRIRELRKARGYSQEGFAAASGLDRSYYGGIERGERNVSLENIAAIARALDVPVRELFPEEEPPGETPSVERG